MSLLVSPLASTFCFSPTLCVATIGGCHLPDDTAQALHFPQLKHLALERVSISECSLHSIIAGCPALECLLINDTIGFRCIRINSLSLRSIIVRVYCYQKIVCSEELIIENAPCLERLLPLDNIGIGLHVSVISVPKLETIDWLSNWKYLSTRLVFGSTVIQGSRVDSLATVVCTVKILAINMYTLSLDMVIDLMRCFPCLEKLYIRSGPSGKKNLWRCKHRNLIRCLDIRLKTVVLEGYYRGIRSQGNFATFFVLNARVLDLTTLVVGANDYNLEFFAQQQRMFQLENRASRDAQFYFTTDSCVHNVSDIKHVHDLALANPFIWTC